MKKVNVICNATSCFWNSINKVKVKQSETVCTRSTIDITEKLLRCINYQKGE